MTKVGVTGHQVIPPSALPHVRTGIARVLATVASGFTGLSSLAAGADQLFARAVLDRGGRLHAIIPCELYESTFTDEVTLESFRALLRAADEIETLPYGSPSQRAFLEAGRRVVDLADLVVAVWDGAEARGAGGTADIVQYACDRGREIAIVWPPGISR